MLAHSQGQKREAILAQNERRPQENGVKNDDPIKLPAHTTRILSGSLWRRRLTLPLMTRMFGQGQQRRAADCLQRPLRSRFRQAMLIQQATPNRWPCAAPSRSLAFVFISMRSDGPKIDGSRPKIVAGDRFSDAVSNYRSFAPQRLERIDFRRAPRRDVARNQGDADKQQCDQPIDRRIGRAHFKEQVFHQSRQR